MRRFENGRAIDGAHRCDVKEHETRHDTPQIDEPENETRKKREKREWVGLRERTTHLNRRRYTTETGRVCLGLFAKKGGRLAMLPFD